MDWTLAAQPPASLSLGCAFLIEPSRQTNHGRTTGRNMSRQCEAKKTS